MRQFFKIFLLVMLVLFPCLLMAQPGGGGSPGDNDVPISGIEYLLGGGLLLGFRYFRNRLKAK
jgi:hypothetical protein